ncbi:MAG: pyridoxal phosphate-dependent aminotransferase [Labilithrix sp.]|nr:pyridoxal phosphate-dependent aminotransferase [Labilithrix sp.]MCW5809620.1 pyridoxal phosphate-dependent aminotransferase [Labilithrix sp.]
MSARGLSRAAARIQPPVFSALQARIDELTARGLELIPLQIGDTHVAPPGAATRALAALAPDDASLHRYGPTAGTAELRAAIAKRAGGGYDAASEVLVGNGGTHALFCAARAVLDEGDEVIVASPYWPLAPGIFSSCGAHPVEAPLTQRLYEDPTLDPTAVFASKLSAKTKALYLISPNNPDGKVLSAAQLARIADFACAHDLWVFSDEVYADVAYEAAPPSIATLPGMRERTVVLHSLSKSHALAGIRVGFCLAPAPVVALGRRVSTHSAFNVSVAMQRAAVAALEEDAFPASACATYRSVRDECARALAETPLRFHVPEGATYFFLDFGTPALPVLERAATRGVLLAPGHAFGSYERFARLCFTAAPRAKVLDGIARLAAALT